MNNKPHPAWCSTSTGGFREGRAGGPEGSSYRGERPRLSAAGSRRVHDARAARLNGLQRCPNGAVEALIADDPGGRSS
jgi:hypothetical protein